MTDAPERIWVEPPFCTIKGEAPDIKWVDEWAQSDGHKAQSFPQKRLNGVEYIRADLAKPAIKPLAWESYEKNVYIALTEIGEYVVRHGDLHTPFMSLDSKRRPHNNSDAAKAAAQADYEQRILSALGVSDE